MTGVDVVVPVYNEAEAVARCIAGVLAQDRPARRVIVVDNGSTDGTAAAAQGFAGVEVLAEHRRGSYAARNTGIRASTAPIVAFTDADCRPRPGWLARAVEALDATGADLVAGHIDQGRGGNLAERYDQVAYLRQEVYVRRYQFGATANLVVRRRVFDEIGLFDETRLSGGDLDFGLRARDAGLRIAFAGDAVVGHRPRRSVRALARKAWRLGGGHARIDDPDFRRWAYSPKRLLPSRVVLTEAWRDPAVVALDMGLSWLALASRVAARRSLDRVGGGDRTMEPR